MDANTVEALVGATIDGAEVHAEGAGAKYEVTVISDIFSDMRAVKKQQTVYAALRDAIADGSIHAVTINTYTRAEWQERGVE